MAGICSPREVAPGRHGEIPSTLHRAKCSPVDFDISPAPVEAPAKRTAKKPGKARPILPPPAERERDPVLRETLLGALLFLEDTQVRDRPGQRSSEYDATDVGDGAKSRIFLNIPFTSRTVSIPSPPGLGIHNKVGEWLNDAHLLPRRLGWRGMTAVSLPDSNSFMTALIAYPLFLLDDPGGSIAKMRRLALDNINSYKHGPGYNFWPALPGATSSSPRVGPLNFPVVLVELMSKIAMVPGSGYLGKLLFSGLDLPPAAWIREIADRTKNPAGADSFFNVPDDADCTAMAVAIQAIEARRSGSVRPDVAALDRLERFRDIERTKENGRDSWKGKDSGAFLTWLRDENEPVFGKAEAGVIPLGVNDVDGVVNANVLLALGLTGRAGSPGGRAAARALAKAIERRVWKRANLYYSQQMMFPYTISRAYREGGVDGPELRSALKSLLTQILDDRDALAARSSDSSDDRRGAFPGGIDQSLDLSTAMGVVTLLNIGRDLAREAGEEARYDLALAEGVAFLLSRRQPYAVRNPETSGSAAGAMLAADSRPASGFSWKPGLAGDVSYPDLCQCRSRAYTVAVTLEALCKYTLGYDQGGMSMSRGARLMLDRTGIVAQNGAVPNRP